MIAVLTGDLVSSTKMSKDTYTNVIKKLQKLIDDANQQFQAKGEIYRGDAFQIQYPTPHHALKSTLLIKLALHLSNFSIKPIQCTLSLAYGDYDTYSDKPNTSSGPAFIQSGRGLEKTARGELSVHFGKDKLNESIELLTQFLNHLLNRLTKTQAQLLYTYIENNFAEHKTLADITGTTRQNISNRLGNIGGLLIRDYISVVNGQIDKIGMNN